MPFEKSQVEFLPLFSCALSKRDWNFGDNIISRIADRRNHHLTELSWNLADEEKTNRRREEMESGWGGPIKLRLRRSRWFSEGRKSRPESAGAEGEEEEVVVLIDEDGVQPLDDWIWFESNYPGLGYERNGIHSRSIHSLCSPAYVSH